MRMSTEPSASPGDDLLLLGPRAEAREQLDLHRKRGEPPPERPVVLVGEDRRRRQQRHLLAVEDRLERGAHGDLGLAVADVPAEKTVHGLLRLHVPFDVGDRLGLVGSLDVLEGVLELLLPGRVLREREPLGEAAAGVELEELVGHVAHGLAHRGLAAGPGRAAQPVQHGRDVLDAGVLLHEIESLDRQEQRLLLGVPDLHELAFLALDRESLQALEAPDAVVGVHDRVAQLQVAQVREKRLARLSPRLRRAPLLAEDLLFGVDGQSGIAQAKARGDLPRERDDGSRAPLGGDVKAVFERQAPELLGSPRRVGGDEHLFSRRERAGQVRRRFGRAAGVAGDRLRRKPEDRGDAFGDSQAIEAERDRGQPLADRVLRVQQLLGSERVAVRVPVGGRALCEAPDLLLDGRGLEKDHEARGRVVEPRGRHPRDRRREHRALRLGRRPADPLGQERPRLVGFLGGREGREPDLFEPLGRALRVGIEEAQRLDPVPVELDTDGQLPIRRKHVEEPAPDSQVSGLDHEV